VLAPIACRQLGIGVADFARSVAAPPLVGALIAALAGSIIRSLLPPQSIASVILEGAAVGVIYLSAVWTLGFDGSSRHRYAAFGREMFETAVHRLGPSTPGQAASAPATTPAHTPLV